MTDIDISAIQFFSELIEKETGIQYDESNKYLLQNRLLNLTKFLNYNNFETLWLDVQAKGLNPMAKSLILDLATNNETSFFRDMHIFDFFKTVFLNTILKDKTHIKIWCAATSTGQEPYSLAMIMSELQQSGLNKTYEILATDISDRVLSQAKKGIYSQLEIQRGLPALLLIKYFEQIASDTSSLPTFKVKPSLGDHISFVQTNLLQEWSFQGGFDIIFCRNVMIYFSIENRKKLIERFAKMLLPNGYLVLGSAESLIGLSDAFQMESYGNASVYKLKGES